jgi:hypothetical protein
VNVVAWAYGHLPYPPMGFGGGVIESNMVSGLSPDRVQAQRVMYSKMYCSYGDQYVHSKLIPWGSTIPSNPLRILADWRDVIFVNLVTRPRRHL